MKTPVKIVDKNKNTLANFKNGRWRQGSNGYDLNDSEQKFYTDFALGKIPSSNVSEGAVVVPEDFGAYMAELREAHTL